MKDLVKSQMLLVTTVLVAILSITSYLGHILAPFIISLIIAHILDPFISYFTRKKWLNIYLATTFVCLLFFSIFFIFLYLIIPILITEITNVSSKLIAYQYPNKLSDLLQPIGDRFPQAYVLFQNSITNLTSMLLNFSKQIFASIINSGKLLFNITAIFLITPILTFYLCLDIKKIKQTMRKLPPKNLQKDIKELFQSINNIIAKFFRGQLMVCLIFASYYSVMFSLLGINSAIALGALTGFSLFIPLIGIFTSLVITAIITYVTMHSYSILGYLAIIFAIGIILESTVVTPKLIGKTLSLHPLWIFLGLFCGGTLFGFFGILFALPLTAATSVFIRFIIQKYKNSKIYNY